MSVITKRISENAETDEHQSAAVSMQTDKRSSLLNDIALEPSQILQTVVLDVNSIKSFKIFGSYRSDRPLTHRTRNNGVLRLQTKYNTA